MRPAITTVALLGCVCVSVALVLWLNRSVRPQEESIHVALSRLSELNLAISVSYPSQHYGAYPPDDWKEIDSYLPTHWTEGYFRERYVYNVACANLKVDTNPRVFPLIIDGWPRLDGNLLTCYSDATMKAVTPGELLNDADLAEAAKRRLRSIIDGDR